MLPPLKRMKLTQPFGVDWTGKNLYATLGMRGHNGWDLSAPNGTEVLAVMNGTAYIEVEAPVGNPPPGYTSGYGINVKIRNRELGLEVIYGHLQNTLIKNNEPVLEGQVIALSDNTGISNAPHLHLSFRPVFWHKDGSGPYRSFPNNGFEGCVDPEMYYPSDIFYLPVDKKYGNQNPPSVLEFAPAFLFFLRSQKRVPTTREYNALRYGYWPLRTVLDPAMFPIWSEHSYPDAKGRKLVK